MLFAHTLTKLHKCKYEAIYIIGFGPFWFLCIIYVLMMWTNCAVLQTSTHIDTRLARRSEYKPQKFQVCHCVKNIDRLPSIFSGLGMTKLFMYRICIKFLLTLVRSIINGEFSTLASFHNHTTVKHSVQHPPCLLRPNFTNLQMITQFSLLRKIFEI